MNDNERAWDKALKIRTSGRDDSQADQYRYPYEPTPYCVLERLVNSGEIGKTNTLLDYGCGKGRVDFFLSYQTRCTSIGVEYDPRICEAAKENQQNAVSGRRVTILEANAENYEVPAEVDRCFFFNPFSVEILQVVLHRILESWYEEPRDLRLYFYYPSDEYVAALMQVDELSFEDEIDCEDLFEGKNSRERILIFQL